MSTTFKKLGNIVQPSLTARLIAQTQTMNTIKKLVNSLLSNLYFVCALYRFDIDLVQAADAGLLTVVGEGKIWHIASASHI